MTKWTVKKAQADPAATADPATTANPADPAAPLSPLPDKFGMRVGALAILNFMRTVRYSGAASHGVDVNALSRDLMTKAQMSIPGGGPAGPATQLPTYDLNNEDFKNIIREAGGMDPLNVLPDSIDPMFASLKDSGQFDPASVEEHRRESLQVNPPPPGGEGTGPWAPELWQSVENAFATAVRSAAAAMKQNVPGIQQTYLPAWSRKRKVLAGPLAEGRYQSIEELKQDLVGMGPKSETYDALLGMVGHDNEDSAKDALTKFFQGDAGALSFIYDLLVGVGLASPIDTQLVETVMEQHPEINEDNKRNAIAGLFLPPADSGLSTKQEKTAGGGVGGTGANEPGYVMYGPGDKRMCPKLRNIVSTFVCRYHCLDGLAIDDAQVVCGEAIWRQSVMDKFSREYKDKDGNWVGGYLNKRFEINRDDGGHPYQLKPGQRHAPINEDAWSPEKRLQEMRRSESGKRNYSDTPGDPEGLYNFDQHDIAKGPRNPGLSEKRKDPIAKIASSTWCIKTSMWGDANVPVEELAQQDPREFGQEPATDEGKVMRILGFVDRNRPRWDSDDAFKDAIRAGDPAAAQGLAPDELAEAVRMLEQSGQATTIAKSTGFNLKRASNPGGDPLMEKGKAGKVADRCPKCGGNLTPGSKACRNCGPVKPGPKGLQYSDALTATGTFPGAEASTKAEVVLANDVYRASKNGMTAFGDTDKEALSKLDKMLDPGNVQEESEELLKIRQEGPGIPAAAPAPVQDGAPLVDPTPSTKEAPPGVAQPVAPEIQGGRSKLKEEAPPDIDPRELDEYLRTASTSGQEDEDTEQIAEASALGPDA